MLPKQYRLPLKYDTNYIGKRFRLGSFLVIHRPNNLLHRRVAFVISKKVCKNAVDRNRLKRQLRHALADWVKTGTGDYLIIALKQTQDLSHNQIQNWVATLKYTL